MQKNDRPAAALSLALVLGGLLILPAMLTGCSWMSYGDKKDKPAVADYRGLDDKTAAIVVFAAEASTDEFPGTREDISSFVEKQMKLHLPKTRLVNYKEITNWQDDTINWYGLTEKEIGKHFSVDRVIYIEVLQYEARAELGYGDLQGRLRCNCKVFEVTSPGNTAAWTGLIDVKWPKNGPADANQTNESALRSRTLALFSDELVGHFYDHKDEDVPLQDR